MTDTNMPKDRVTLTAKVRLLIEQLDEARADVALLRRLKDAEKNAARLSAELDATQEALAVANTNQAIASRKALFANFGKLSIVAVPVDRSTSPLAARYTITCERLTYDSTTRESTMQPVSYSDFDCLPHDVFAYLVEVKADAIPASILSLAADGDPATALQEYLRGKKRGYLTIPAAA